LLEAGIAGLDVQGGAPGFVRFDTVPEFNAHAVVDWCRLNELQPSNSASDPTYWAPSVTCINWDPVPPKPRDRSLGRRQL
jgi:hypothetical protein